MLTSWRDCPRCRKSFDAVYRGFFGCRACGFFELVNQAWRDLTTPLQVNYRKKSESSNEKMRVVIRTNFYGRRVA